MTGETTKAKFAAHHGLIVETDEAGRDTGRLLDGNGDPVAYSAFYAVTGEGSTRKVWRDPETGEQLGRFTLTIPYQGGR
jgi:hypothetical protein